MSDIVTDIRKYQQGWKGGLPETPCGHGSKLESTVNQRKWIPELIKKYKIKSINDIGAGDLNWIKHMDLCGAEYTPYDFIPRKPEVRQFNLIEDIPPKADMIMCLWVLNHFTMDQAEQATHNLVLSDAKYLLLTDRERYRKDQPEFLSELLSTAIESLMLNDKNDAIRLIKL